jgi:hypothetical protein
VLHRLESGPYEAGRGAAPVGSMASRGTTWN